MTSAKSCKNPERTWFAEMLRRCKALPVLIAVAYFLSNTESQIARYKERGLIPTDLKALEDKDIQSDPARKAISDQQPFSHGQGSSVGGKYWSTNVGGFGGEIVTKKGKISDDELKKSLQSIQTQIDT